MSKDKHALIKANIALNKKVQELESFKKSVEYTVDSETLELIIDNQDSDRVLSFSETYDEKIYLLQKRVQELEGELEKGETLLEKILPIYKRLKKQNKRYREYLELIRITGTHGKDIKTGEIIRSDEANLADEALEGDSDE